MPKQSIAIIKMALAVFCAGLLTPNLTATSCWGANKVTTDAAITLDVKNEPLRSVLQKITKTTRWKINAPGKWLDRPVTQTLNKASLEEGLRSLLKNVGVENLLLMYDDEIRAVTIFDVDGSPGQAADRSPAHVNAQPSGVSATAESDLRMNSPERNTGFGPARRRARRQASEDE